MMLMSKKEKAKMMTAWYDEEKLLTASHICNTFDKSFADWLQHRYNIISQCRKEQASVPVLQKLDYCGENNILPSRDTSWVMNVSETVSVDVPAIPVQARPTAHGGKSLLLRTDTGRVLHLWNTFYRTWIHQSSHKLTVYQTKTKTVLIQVHVMLTQSRICPGRTSNVNTML